MNNTSLRLQVLVLYYILLETGILSVFKLINFFAWERVETVLR